MIKKDNLELYITLMQKHFPEKQYIAVGPLHDFPIRHLQQAINLYKHLGNSKDEAEKKVLLAVDRYISEREKANEE